MKTTKAERKNPFKKILTFCLSACLAVCAGVAIKGFAGDSVAVKAADENVEIMNAHFTAAVDSNGYRTDFITDQMVVLQYDKQFHETDAWLNDKASTNYTIDGMDLGNYLVINGMTFNEIRTKYSGVYASVDNRTNLSKGGDWTPVTVRAYPDRIYLAIHRGFTDIGAMTVGLKNGFSFVYDGTTYKTEGDLIFKSTLDPTSNFESPVFVKQESADETEHAIETFTRSLEDGGVNGEYKCLRFFPLLGAGYNSAYQSRVLGDHYLYAKDYLLINDKPVNYWNIVTYSSEDDYTTNPVGNSGRMYSTPVVAHLYNNGEFQIWMHTAWAARNGIDFDNVKISLDKGFPFVKTDGKVYITANKFSAERINGSVFCTKDEKEITPTVAIDNVTEQTALKHLVVDVTLSEAMDDIVWHMIDGYAANNNALTKIYINGKSVSEINSQTDTTDWDWSGGYGFSETNRLLQKPVLILCNGGKMTIYINGQYRDLLANGKNTDVKLKIDDFSVLYQPNNTTPGVKYLVNGTTETSIYNRTYTFSVYKDGKDGEAVTSQVTHGDALTFPEAERAGYTLKWVDADGKDALTVMPESDYAVYAQYEVITYTVDVTYLDGTTEKISYNVENREAKLNAIKAKFTADTDEYEYLADKTELPLENSTLKEVRKAKEYTVTIKFLDNTTDTVRFTVENRADVRAELERRLTESDDAYTYSWKGGLPETLPLKDFEIQAERTAKHYMLTLNYYDGEKQAEDIDFTVETRGEVLKSLAAKLTAAAGGYEYEWKDLPDELPLKNLTLTERRTAIVYALTVVYSDDRKENETATFTVENRSEVYASLAEKLLPTTAEYSYAWDKTELPLENTTITEIKTAVEYTLTIKYLVKPEETVKFTVENKDTVYNALADKLTADDAAYEYSWDKDGLSLENTVINEVKTAKEYTLTIVYADKDPETVKFTVETRASVLASLAEKLTPKTKNYEYSWDNLPEELELKNVTVTEIKTAIKQPEKKGCGSAIGGGALALMLGLFGAFVALKKKEN